MDNDIIICIDNLENEIRKLNFFVDKYFSEKLEKLDKELQRLKSLFEAFESNSQGLEQY